MDIPDEFDDKIIRIVPISSSEARQLNEIVEQPQSSIDLSILDERERGAELYKLYCSACHKTDGTGSEGLYPPLTDHEWVKNKGELVSTVLNGLSGIIKVHGVSYEGEMPAFKFLSNKELTDILNYVRTSFGNNAVPITEEELESLR